VSDVTHILEALQRGTPQAAETLLPLVYSELRRLAAHKMAREQPGHTLQPTALVHEAWLRLGADAQPARQNPLFCRPLLRGIGGGARHFRAHRQA
jgi:hypothetical protein